MRDVGSEVLFDLHILQDRFVLVFDFIQERMQLIVRCFQIGPVNVFGDVFDRFDDLRGQDL